LNFKKRIQTFGEIFMMLKKPCQSLAGLFKKTSGSLLSFCIVAQQALADLPTPPSDEIPSGNTSWIDVGGSLIFKVMEIVLIVGAAGGCIAAIGGFIKAYHTAQEKQDLSHFAKYGFLSVFLMVICLAIAYYATTDIIKAAST
jgi:hypothetical protein